MSKLAKKIKAGVAGVAIATAAAAATPTESVVKFDPSQRRLFQDESRVIVVNWHRQKGKDFTAANKAVDHALRTGQTWYIVSLTQRQADATFEKCKQAVRTIKGMLRIVGEDQIVEYGVDQFDKTLNQTFHMTAREIRLPGGGRVVSLPGRDPDTLAGLTGNIIFTEFGLFPNGGYAHWRVVFPLTTRGFQCIIISTPRGKNTKFYELFQNSDGAYSVHFCDIYRSVAEDGFVLKDNSGNPTTIEEFKKLYGDMAGFDREYGCLFTGDVSALITWAELERAAALPNLSGFVYARIDNDRGTVPIFQLRQALNGSRSEIGWDVARRGHLSPIVINQPIANQPKRMVGLILMHACSFEFMRNAVIACMDIHRANVGHGDATGLGMESNETLQKRYGDRWTPFTFTSGGKREAGSALKTAFNDGTQTIPSLDGPYKFVATDLYAIQKDDEGANLVLSETINPLLEESHCDIAYATALARLAGSSVIHRPMFSTPEKPEGF